MKKTTMGLCVAFLCACALGGASTIGGIGNWAGHGANDYPIPKLDQVSGISPVF